jgi:hypothetical protein
MAVATRVIQPLNVPLHLQNFDQFIIAIVTPYNDKDPPTETTYMLRWYFTECYGGLSGRIEQCMKDLEGTRESLRLVGGGQKPHVSGYV